MQTRNFKGTKQKIIKKNNTINIHFKYDQIPRAKQVKQFIFFYHVYVDIGYGCTIHFCLRIYCPYH